jgi:hypothetical protein
MKERFAEYKLSFKTGAIESLVYKESKSENDKEIIEEKKDPSQVEKQIDEVLEECTPLEKKQLADLWEKKGGTEQALKDFKSFEPKGIQPIPTGERGVLSDGKDINVRTKSLDGRTTLEIYDRSTKRSIKIRYEE